MDEHDWSVCTNQREQDVATIVGLRCAVDNGAVSILETTQGAEMGVRERVVSPYQPFCRLLAAVSALSTSVSADH
jgi:hypothetical protein